VAELKVWHTFKEENPFFRLASAGNPELALELTWRVPESLCWEPPVPQAATARTGPCGPTCWPLQPNVASPETQEVVVRGSHQHMARGSSGEPAKTRLSTILTVLAVLTLLACAVIDVTLHALVPNESVSSPSTVCEQFRT
jgi:hypothetical protein